MRTLVQAMLAMVVVLAGVAVAPTRASAQECVARHASWVNAAPAGTKRVEHVELVQTNDTQGWTGHGVMDLDLLRSFVFGNIFVPARLLGAGQLTYSDRHYCATAGLCINWQAFSIFDVDSVSVQVFLATSPTGWQATLHFNNDRWGWQQVTSVGTCVNNNTVLFTAPGMSYLMTFSDVETRP